LVRAIFACFGSMRQAWIPTLAISTPPHATKKMPSGRVAAKKGHRLFPDDFSFRDVGNLGASGLRHPHHLPYAEAEISALLEVRHGEDGHASPDGGGIMARFRTRLRDGLGQRILGCLRLERAVLLPGQEFTAKGAAVRKVLDTPLRASIPRLHWPPSPAR